MELRLGILVSGEGTNLQALIDSIRKKELDARIVLVISNKSNALAVERAKKAGIPSLILGLGEFPDRQAYDEALAKALLKEGVDLVVLAGFMHILSPVFLRHFPDRVINLHPALLPENPEKDEVILPDGVVSKVFRGKDVVTQSLRAGVSWTGCSVHLVTERVDCGPLLKSQPVPILSGDTPVTLHARIQQEEHRILPIAVGEWGSKLRLQGKI